jgi:hypothetical protein
MVFLAGALRAGTVLATAGFFFAASLAGARRDVDPEDADEDFFAVGTGLSGVAGPLIVSFDPDQAGVEAFQPSMSQKFDCWSNRSK